MECAKFPITIIQTMLKVTILSTIPCEYYLQLLYLIYLQHLQITNFIYVIITIIHYY